jgi:hypothetical protein
MPVSSDSDDQEVPTVTSISAWLQETHSSNPDPAYFHTRFAEQPDKWDRVSAQVATYFREAHSDAIQRLRRLAGISLHPAGAATSLPRPYETYPFGLPTITLQGYFGEILAGLLAEEFGAAGREDWEVPAHLFHTHVLVFQQLARQAQTGVTVETIVGRTGDDCLAFRRDEQRTIASVLYCEAKCTRDHDSTLINDAHEKCSSGAIVDIFQLIEALESRNSSSATEWADALRVFHSQLHATPAVAIDRIDAVYYVHGQAPVRSDTWISPDGRPNAYVADRTLHSVEICLADVETRMRSIYRAEVWQ